MTVVSGTRPDRRCMTTKPVFKSVIIGDCVQCDVGRGYDVFGSLILTDRERDFVLKVSSVEGNSSPLANDASDVFRGYTTTSALNEIDSIPRGSLEASEGADDEFKSSFGEPVDAFTLLHGLEYRTTVMFRRVPRRMTSKSFQDLIESLPGMYQSVEFIYLPRDNIRKSNRGFAFVNFFNPVSLAILASMLSNSTTCPSALQSCMMFFARIQGSGSQLSKLIDSTVTNKVSYESSIL